MESPPTASTAETEKVRERPLHEFLIESDPDGFEPDPNCFYTPWIDVHVLLQLVRRYQPSRFLEIGTHRGVTTRILAKRFPEMAIVTVDPGDQIPMSERPAIQLEEFLPQDQIGELVRDYANVTVIRQRFEDIAWGDQRFEMVFVDGNHRLPHVLKDSYLALQLVTSPGVIVWHDYGNVPDVSTALGQLDVEGTIVALQNTWIAYLDTR
jgi:predicted O-methyltransferase YrrM